MKLLLWLYVALIGVLLFAAPAHSAGTATTLRVSNVAVTEGQTAHPAINKSGGNGRAVTVAWHSADGRSGSVTVGSAPVALSLTTTDDNLVNGTRTLTVNATVTSGSVHPTASGIVTILDNDVAVPLPVISVVPVSVDENAGTVLVHIVRSGDLTGTTTFSWATQDATAIHGINYGASSGGRGFGPGQSDLTASVQILDDGKVQGDLVFNVMLSGIVGGQLGKNGPVTVRNVDVDPVPAPTPAPTPAPAPTPTPAPAPAPGTVVALSACPSLTNPADVLVPGASYTVAGFAGISPYGTMTNPAAKDIVVLNDATHRGDGWFALFVPVACVQ